MKYIRTKDGHIFEAEKDLWLYGRSRLQATIDMQGNVIDVTSHDNVLKEADDIKELCDFFLLVDKNEYDNDWIDDEIATKDYQRLFDEFRARLVDGSDIRKMAFYGCILVFDDNGLPILKPVAKLNKKEWWEFELL